MVLLYFLTAVLFWGSWFLLNSLLNMRSWKIGIETEEICGIKHCIKTLY